MEKKKRKISILKSYLVVTVLITIALIAFVLLYNGGGANILNSAK